MARRRPRSLSELRPGAEKHLDGFTDPTKLYAFATYDRAEVHEGPLTAADVLMANLLSLRLGWRDVIPLFTEQTHPRQHWAGHLTPLLTKLARSLRWRI